MSLVLFENGDRAIVGKPAPAGLAEN